VPRVTIAKYEGLDKFVAAETCYAGYDDESDLEWAVDMNASLFRQIQHAEKQYQKFQGILRKFFNEAAEQPDSIRRVR
jgi:hypothetical protein